MRRFGTWKIILGVPASPIKGKIGIKVGRIVIVIGIGYIESMTMSAMFLLMIEQ